MVAGRHRIGANSKVGCVLDIDFKKIGQNHEQSFMSHDVYGHSCAITGAVWNLDGREFDGIGGYIDCGNPTILNITGSITLEVNAKVDKINPADIQSVVGKYNSAVTDQMSWLLSNPTNAALVEFLISQDGNNGEGVSSSTGLVVGKWHHLTGVYNASSLLMSVFKDGVQNSETTTYTSLKITPQNVLIGAQGAAAGGTRRFLDGHISRAKVYNYADYTAKVLQRAINSKNH